MRKATELLMSSALVAPRQLFAPSSFWRLYIFDGRARWKPDARSCYMHSQTLHTARAKKWRASENFLLLLYTCALCSQLFHVIHQQARAIKELSGATFLYRSQLYKELFRTHYAYKKSSCWKNQSNWSFPCICKTKLNIASFVFWKTLFF